MFGVISLEQGQTPRAMKTVKQAPKMHKSLELMYRMDSNPEQVIQDRAQRWTLPQLISLMALLALQQQCLPGSFDCT